MREKNRREDILAAAADIFGTKGFHAANIIDIADKAGIGKGTIYEYFESKNSLFIEVVKYSADSYSSTIEKQINKHTSFHDKFTSFIKCHKKVIAENIKSAEIFLRFPLEISLTDEDKEELCSYLVTVRKNITDVLTDVLMQGQKESRIRETDIGFAADMLLEMITRHSIRGFLLNLSEEQKAMDEKKLISLFMTGAGKYN